MPAYYNENDKGAAAWLRELIKAGMIAPGVVDERSIEDVKAEDLAGFDQCHFFAGIGGWSYALRLAGWPDSRPVWTGSCPCQPFSVAGKGKGKADKRHLWPEWFRLIKERKPTRVYGEQVASAINHGWLDLVFDDLERENYACGAICLPACSVGAAHIRQRLWFMADSDCSGLGEQCGAESVQAQQHTAERDGNSGKLANANDRDTRKSRDSRAAEGARCSFGTNNDNCGQSGKLADTADYGHAAANGLREEVEPSKQAGQNGIGQLAGGGDNSFWANPDWLYCRDKKWRPVESGSFPLAHGLPGRVGLLRGYGNAIVPEVAAEIIRATM